MILRKRVCFFGLLLATTLLSPSWGQEPLNPKTKAPIITNSFAAEKGNYGYIWRIYIEAEDSDGDMVEIVSVVDKMGYGPYAPNRIPLKPQYRKNLRGYIQWNTFSSITFSLREWTQINLKVSILDRAGNASNVVVFQFTFESGIKDQYNYTLPPPFDQRGLPRLGYIHTDLFEPTEMGGAGPGSIR